MDTQIEQLNLSSITKFALAYAGITTVSELKEYNYISLANVLPRNCSLNPIMKELNTYCYIFPPENEIPISSIPMSKRLYNILDRNNILYISQLTHYAREEIMQFRNLGSTTLIELDALCQKYHVKINSLSIVKESLQQFNFPSKLYIYLFRNNIHHINDFNDKTVYDLYCICNKDYLLTMKTYRILRKHGNTPKSWHDKFLFEITSEPKSITLFKKNKLTTLSQFSNLTEADKKRITPALLKDILNYQHKS